MKTKATFTIDQLIAKVRELAAKHPATKYVPPGHYTGCKYTKGEAGGGCGCLLGQALVSLQPDLLPLLMHLDAKENVTIDDLLVDHISIDGFVPWLTEVQQNQDMGKTWSVAVATADMRCPL